MYIFSSLFQEVAGNLSFAHLYSYNHSQKKNAFLFLYLASVPLMITDLEKDKDGDLGSMVPGLGKEGHDTTLAAGILEHPLLTQPQPGNRSLGLP